MNTFRRCILVCGLTLAVASVAFAQSVAQSGTASKMVSCCDSCDMTKKDAMKNHVMSADKHDCCGCCGDSCDMKKKDAMKNHASSSDKHGCCSCCGDSCDMKKKDAMKNHVNSSDKHECCCGGDSCDMKTLKDVKKS